MRPTSACLRSWATIGVVVVAAGTGELRGCGACASRHCLINTGDFNSSTILLLPQDCAIKNLTGCQRRRRSVWCIQSLVSDLAIALGKRSRLIAQLVLHIAQVPCTGPSPCQAPHGPCHCHSIDTTVHSLPHLADSRIRPANHKRALQSHPPIRIPPSHRA